MQHALLHAQGQRQKKAQRGDADGDAEPTAQTVAEPARCSGGSGAAGRRDDASWRLSAALGRRLSDDPAGFDAQHATGHGGDARLVRDQEQGQALALIQGVKQLDDLAAGIDVQVAGRLVTEQELRPKNSARASATRCF